MEIRKTVVIKDLNDNPDDESSFRVRADVAHVIWNVAAKDDFSHFGDAVIPGAWLLTFDDGYEETIEGVGRADLDRLRTKVAGSVARRLAGPED